VQNHTCAQSVRIYQTAPPETRQTLADPKKGFRKAHLYIQGLYLQGLFIHFLIGAAFGSTLATLRLGPTATQQPLLF
jgi:uncharacterized protein YktB (UPF0637 family)